MIRISELAAEALHETLVGSGIDTGRMLRLTENGVRLVLELDGPGGNDRIVQGVTILLVDLRLEGKIGDALIDVEAEPEQPHLVIRLAT